LRSFSTNPGSAARARPAKRAIALARRQSLRIGHRERRHRKGVLSGNPKQRPACRQHGQGLAGRKERRHLRRGIQHMLHIVEDQEQLAIAKDCAERPGAQVPDADGLGDRRHHEVGVADRGKPGECDAVAVVMPKLRRHLYRQARLAGSAGTGQCQQPDVGPDE
jgi:hypothetical protein